jgi:hypothetical protein
MVLPPIFLAVLRAVVLALAAQAAAAQAPDRPPTLPDVPSRNAKGGFSGAMLVTADPDWKEKWMTPSNGAGVRFGTTRVVRLGERVNVLTFLSNPGLDSDGRADVRCTLRVTGPDGQSSTEGVNEPCFNGKLAGPPQHAYMANLALHFFAEPSDPVGVYRVDMLLRDEVRGIDLPLRIAYELLPPGR